MRIYFATIDEIPEHLRKDAVKQDDGQFVLEGDGAQGILNKNKELLADNVKMKAIAEKFKELGEGADVAKIKQALADMATAEQREAEFQQRLSVELSKAAETFKGRITQAEKDRLAMQSSLEERIIDADLTTAIAAAEGDPFFVLPALRTRVKTFVEEGKYVARVVDEKGKVALNEEGKPKTIEQLVTEAKADTKYSKVFAAPKAAGSGAQGSGAGSGNGGGAKGTVTLSRADATDGSKFQAALASVDGDYSRVQYTNE